MDISTDADIQDNYVKNDDEETNDARNHAPSGHQLRKENPATQDIVFVNNNVLFSSNVNENVFHRDNDIINDKYIVNNCYDTENVYKRDNKHINIMYKPNKNNYAGYHPNFINPILLPDKYFNYTSILNKVNYLLNQNQNNNKTLNNFKQTNSMMYGTPQIIKAHNLEGRRGRPNSHVIKAHNMKSRIGREFPPAINTHSMKGDSRFMSKNINQHTKQQHTQNTVMNTTLTHAHTLKHNTTPHPHSHNKTQHNQHTTPHHTLPHNTLTHTHRKPTHTPLNLVKGGNSPTIKAHSLERGEFRYNDLTL